MTSSRTALPWAFFVLVLLLTAPFWWIGAGGRRLPFATFLPLSALMTFIPMIAALVLIFRARGMSGAGELLGRSLDFGRIKKIRWVLAALLLMPVAFFLQYGVLRLSGAALPDPQFFPIAEVLVYFLMFFIGAVGEELGWQGYAFGGLRERWNALATGLIIGVIWALWHVIPFVELGRSGDWIVWHCLGMVAMRVIIVWLLVNAGQSVFVAVLFHTMSNMPYGVLSNYGSYYYPFVTVAILTILVTVIVAFWGRATLARFTYPQAYRR